MVVCAALLLLGALLSATMIDNNVLRMQRPGAPSPAPECKTCLPVGAPPLEPGSPGRAARLSPVTAIYPDRRCRAVRTRSGRRVDPCRWPSNPPGLRAVEWPDAASRWPG